MLNIYKIEAFFLLIVFRLLIFLLPFHTIQKVFKRCVLSESINDIDLRAELINNAVLFCCRIIPWENKCLVRAAVIKFMLDRRGIESAFKLGLSRDSDKNIEAHAWIEYNGKVFVESSQQDSFSFIYYL